MKRFAGQLLLAALVGALVGVLTVLGQKYLPGDWNSLANSGAVWLVPAFFTALCMKQSRGKSMALCILCLLLCVFGYYGLEAWMNGHSFPVGGMIVVWLGCAVLGGAIFGYGAYLHGSGKGWKRSVAINLLPAVFLAEGLNKLIHFAHYAHMAGAVAGTCVLGVALYFALNRRQSFVWQPLACVAVLTVLGLIGYEALFWLAA